MSPMDTLLEVGIDLPSKIQEIYDQCNDEEKSILVQILMELSQTGESQTYKDLWYQDYKEIPVDLDTFLCDDRYLGKVTRNGEGIYPYWKTAMPTNIARAERAGASLQGLFLQQRGGVWRKSITFAAIYCIS